MLIVLDLHLNCTRNSDSRGECKTALIKTQL